ncbi:mitochondrial proton/calcium exchanger protein [Lepeophtheirus salmonis]|uniref:mitochondrial proton/calcium exchanger protein n=1 Tax=Lepeophtheirus salmonis TaxID=72036 RepID=UPI001AEA8D1F|nr:mitochondrial proton/calcium exchanger protein-like [Lepeophtheirus salmonis]
MNSYMLMNNLMSPRMYLASGSVLLRFRLTQNTSYLRYIATDKGRGKSDLEPPIPILTKLPKISSSKVEDTVQRLKERQRQRLQDVSQMQEVEKNLKNFIAQDPNLSKNTIVSSTLPKKSLWIRFVDEVKHYYHGFKLLYLDVKFSSKIIWKVLNGNSLSRRENKQLVRTVSDLFRLLPFSVFVLVPFMEFLLPVALKLFPGMLPSTFTTSSERDNNLRRVLKAKLEYAKFLQKTLDEMVPQSKNHSSQSAKDFVDFYTRVKSGEAEVKNEEILKFSKLFEDEITLDNMRRGQLVAICRLLELTPFGNNNFLRFQIEMKLRQLKTDDLVIQKEGIGSLSVRELQNACRERGMRAFGLSEERLKNQLSQWLDLSINACVPPSLLLLSRTLYLPETLDTTAQIRATISSLPEFAATQTKATIGEREGKIENITRLEVLKEEQRKIEEEALEEKEKDIPQVLSAPVKPKVVVQKVITNESIIESKEKVATTDKDKVLSTDDLKNLKQVIETMGVSSSKSDEDHSSEKYELTDLKKELEDYEHDVQLLKEAKVDAERPDIEETKAAKRLLNKLHKMVNKADIVLDTLHKKEEIYAKIEGSEPKGLEEDNFVTIQDLINSVQVIQKTLSASKLDQITEILAQVDVDSDGVINVDHVLKVINLLDKNNLNSSVVHVHKIVDMLEKEEALEYESEIENIIGSASLNIPDDESTSKQLAEEEVKIVRDIAKDLTETEPEPHIKEMFPKDSNK